MKHIVVLLLATAVATAQDVKLLSFNTGNSVVIRWIGNTNPAIDGWHVVRSVDNGMWTRLTTNKLTRVYSRAEAIQRVGAYRAAYYMMLYGVEGQRDLTSADVARTLTSTNVGFHFAMLATQPDVSDLCGERYTDSTIMPGSRTVKYRVEGFVGDQQVITQETKQITIDDPSSVPVPTSIEATGLDNSVRLRWPRFVQHSDSGDVVAFRVWKGLTENGPFEEITSLSILTMFGSEEDEKWYSFIDEFIENGIHAWYYVRQIHGTGILGDRSEIIEAIAGSNAEPIAPSHFKASTIGNAIQLNWKLNGNYTTSELQLIRIEGGSNKKTGRELSNSDTSYLDALVQLGTPYSYCLVVTNSDKSVASDTLTFAIPDDVAPSAPTNLTATADTGKIRLKWNRSVDEDVIGYHVYRSSSARFSSLLQVTSAVVKDTTFTDVLSRDAEGYHAYVVRAEDASGNSSETSVQVIVKTIDVTPPPTPQFLSFVIDKGNVSMSWSSSNAADLSNYLIEQSDSASTWKTAQTTTSTQTIVNSLSSGRHRFRVVATDSTGNRSVPSDERVTIVEQQLTAPAGLTASKDKFSIQLSWNGVNDAKGYRVSRVDPRTGKKTVCASLDANVLKWADKISQRDLEWKYEVSARDGSWKFGPVSSVIFKP